MDAWNFVYAGCLRNHTAPSFTSTSPNHPTTRGTPSIVSFAFIFFMCHFFFSSFCAALLLQAEDRETSNIVALKRIQIDSDEEVREQQYCAVIVFQLILSFSLFFFDLSFELKPFLHWHVKNWRCVCRRADQTCARNCVWMLIP